MRLLAAALVVLAAQVGGQQQPDVCPCRTRLQCPDHYGTRPLDVLHFGVLGPCHEYGHFRCCPRAGDGGGLRHHAVLGGQLGVGRRAPSHRRRPPVRAVTAATSGTVPHRDSAAVSATPAPSAHTALNSGGPTTSADTPPTAQHPGHIGPSETDTAGPFQSAPGSSPAVSAADLSDISPAVSTAGLSDISPAQTDSAPPGTAQQAILISESDSSSDTHSKLPAGNAILPSSDATSLDSVEAHFEDELRNAGHVIESSILTAVGRLNQHGEPKATVKPFPVISTSLNVPVTEAAFQSAPAEFEDKISLPVADIEGLTFSSTPVAETVFHQVTVAETTDEPLPKIDPVSQVPAVTGDLEPPTADAAGSQLGRYVLDERAAREHPVIRAFRAQTVTPVVNITRTGELSPPCGCYPCGTCGAAHRDAGRRSSITCPAGFERCCFPEDPWPDFVATEAESSAPCSLPSRCRRPYGESARDVELFGLLLPCYLGQVRCLDLVLQQAELMSPAELPPCAEAGSETPLDAELSAPIPDVQFKMSLSEPDDQSTKRGEFQLHGELPTLDDVMTTSTPPVEEDKIQSFSEPEPSGNNNDHVSPSQQLGNISTTNAHNQEEEEEPFVVNSQPDFNTLLKPLPEPLLIKEGTRVFKDALLPASDYLLPTEPFPTTPAPALDERATDYPTPPLNSVYLPPDTQYANAETPAEYDYDSSSSELDSSASSLVTDLHADKSTVYYDLDGAASSIDYELDTVESGADLVPKPVASPRSDDFSEVDDSWMTDDLAPAASLLSAVGVSPGHHGSPGHHHHHPHHSAPSAHPLPSSGLHVIPAPDLSLLPPPVHHDEAHTAGAHIHEASDVPPAGSQTLVNESQTSVDAGDAHSHHVSNVPLTDSPPSDHSESPNESQPIAEIRLPETYLPVPLETNEDQYRNSPEPAPLPTTASDLHASKATSERDVTSLDIQKEKGDNNNDVVENQSPPITESTFEDFVASAKPEKQAIDFPDSVSVEIPEGQHSSVQIPVPCQPLANCQRLFGESARDYELLGSLPECPEGEGRCLDHVLLVYTRLGKHEELLFGDMSAIKTSGTIIEIMGSPTADENAPIRSMVVHGTPEFKRTVTLLGAKMMFPTSSQKQHLSHNVELNGKMTQTQNNDQETFPFETSEEGELEGHRMEPGTVELEQPDSGDTVVTENTTVEFDGNTDGITIHTDSASEGAEIFTTGSAASTFTRGSQVIGTASHTENISSSGAQSGQTEATLHVAQPGLHAEADDEAGVAVVEYGVAAVSIVSSEGMGNDEQLHGHATVTDLSQGLRVGHHFSRRPQGPLAAHGRPSHSMRVNGASPPEPRYGAPPRQSRPQYGTPSRPKPEYGPPPSPKPQYEPPQPKPQYGAPPPKPHYGAPSQPKPEYGPPPSPKPQYEPPQPKPQYGAPPPPKPQHGAPSPPKPKYGPPPSPKPQYGAPPPPKPQYGAPLPPKPQYGPPPPPKPQYGAPPPPKPQYEAPPPPKPQYGAPPPPKPQYGPPPPPKPQYGAPPPPKPQYGAPPPPKPQYGPPPPPKPQYGAPPLPKPQYGAPLPPRPQYGPPPPKPKYGPPPSPKPQYGAPHHPQSKPQYGPPPRPKPQYGPPRPKPQYGPAPTKSQYGAPHPTTAQHGSRRFPAPSASFQRGPRPAPVGLVASNHLKVQPRPQFGPRPAGGRYPPARPGSHYT
ncbi:uncharacterized protein LOC122388976 [Amphibalanus amphitrite]|uniref:uncharacterized protein LOC122388976 n=1 Tax=Amphibalanus amphitrite TaxID=1232801 RepID=UPI001C90DAC1|nr:uncharacterized protein LOC122388976 [Amphibalanus amphitrite]XP_043236522.1 uncharacterized protein LOC122388976 [Amphibalanus amphitrite]